VTLSFRLAAVPPLPSVRARAATMMFLLTVANVLVWVWVWAAFGESLALLGSALLAYGLGLRHAVDADHIAAIDNVTRKMMEAGKRPVTLGMFFSLGHSAIVFALTLAVVGTTATLASLMEPIRAFASVFGAGLSSLFLVAVAAINLMTLMSLTRALRRTRHGGEYIGDLHEPVLQGGLMVRVLAPLSRCVARNWHMFFVGSLFGLGFETASEVSLLGLSVTEMTNGLSPWSILVFPAVFAAGMSLLDAADGVVMVGVYGWALSRPSRRLVYNIIITTLSVFVALLIAGIEIFGLLAAGDEKSSVGAPLFGLISVDMNSLGYLVVFVFIATWLVAIAASRVKVIPLAARR
jgi:nickel/cobalt transporter (NiCoT) family protein